MKVVYTYSHLGGAEILQVRYPAINDQINRSIAAIKVPKKTKKSKEKGKKGRMLYSPIEINTRFRNLLADKYGFKELRVSHTITLPNYPVRIKGPFKQIDFVKDRVLVEVQLGKYFSMFYDMAKFQFFYNENRADVGVEIVVTNRMKRQMSSGVAYGEQLVFDIERLKRHFPAVPVKVMLIDVDDAPDPTPTEVIDKDSGL